MIDHITFKVRDYGASKRFYQATLLPLGYRQTSDERSSGGFGADGRTDVWITEGTPDRPAQGAWHVALAAPDRKAVQAFHQAALAHGGRDNGAPGIRTDYAPTYYAAFVLDPDGNNLEAVCLR